MASSKKKTAPAATVFDKIITKECPASLVYENDKVSDPAFTDIGSAVRMVPIPEDWEKKLEEIMIRFASGRFLKLDERLTALEKRSEGIITTQNTRNNACWRGRPELTFDFPLFDGSSDPDDWIYRVEQLLSYYQTPIEDWVTVASIHLRGVACNWFRRFNRTRDHLDFGDFKENLMMRFGSPLQYYMCELFKLQQTGTVNEYLNEFDRLAAKVSDLSESNLLPCFVGGLTDFIRIDVECFRPANLSNAITLARLNEAKVAAEMKRYSTGGSSRKSDRVTRVTRV